MQVAADEAVDLRVAHQDVGQAGAAAPEAVVVHALDEGAKRRMVHGEERRLLGSRGERVVEIGDLRGVDFAVGRARDRGVENDQAQSAEIDGVDHE